MGLWDSRVHPCNFSSARSAGLNETFVVESMKRTPRIKCMRERMREEVKLWKCMNMVSEGSGYHGVTSLGTSVVALWVEGIMVLVGLSRAESYKEEDQGKSSRVPAVWNDAVLLQHGEAPGELQVVVRPRRWATNGTERGVACTYTYKLFYAVPVIH